MYNTTNTRYLLNGGGPGSTMSDCNPRCPLAVNRKPATGFPTYRSERSLLLFFFWHVTYYLLGTFYFYATYFTTYFVTYLRQIDLA